MQEDDDHGAKWGEDKLSWAYHDFAAAAVLEAHEQSDGEKMAATNATLKAFMHRWELFCVAYDHVEELAKFIC